VEGASFCLAAAALRYELLSVTSCYTCYNSAHEDAQLLGVAVNR